ncbi:MAG: hypothetical protein SGPRY_012581 [Prymnesium sp.]
MARYLLALLWLLLSPGMGFQLARERSRAGAASDAQLAAPAPVKPPGFAVWGMREAEPHQIFLRTLAAYGVVTLLLSPLTEPILVEQAVGKLLAMSPLVHDFVMRACRALYALRTTYTLQVLLCHEVLTDVSADIVAQAVARRAEGVNRMSVDWRRVPRSVVAAMFSDDIPFLLCSPKLVVYLTHPVSNALYLALQAGMRGRGELDEDCSRRIANELRMKFFSVWRDGLMFWSAAHIVVFAMPIWWLQPIVDNIFTLIFNVYLAIAAHRTIV